MVRKSIRKRILIFSATASPVGGVETWLDRVCDYISKSNLDPIVGLVRGAKFNDPGRFRAFHPHLQTVEIDGRDLNSDGRIRALRRCIKKVRPSLVMPMGIVEANDAAILEKCAGVDLKLMTHAQGNLPAMLADLKHYQAAIDHVVCPGKLTQRLLTSWGGFDENRISHVPNGADLATHSRTNRQPNHLRIGYVGRLTANDKRVLDLIPLHTELVLKDLNFKLTIVGSGPMEGELRNALEGQPNVVFAGPVTPAELYARIFPELDILVLCSSSEAFGIVLAEAMMNGVVPVTSQYLGFHSEQLVTDECTGLSFPIGEMAVAAEQIGRLAADRSLLDRISETCRSQTTANYSWSRCLADWEQIIWKVIDKPSIPIAEPMKNRMSSSPGRLEQLGMPPKLVDLLRRIRRASGINMMPQGGEEWPFCYKGYDPTILSEVSKVCRELDAPVHSVCPH